MVAIAKLLEFKSVTSDVVVFTIENRELEVLLIKRANKPFLGSWALPGGFISREEGSRDAALRVLKEKAGVANVYLEQLFTFDDSGRDPRGRVCTIAYFALVPRSKIKFEKGKSIQTPLFFHIKNLPGLAFDHKKIIRYAAKRLRSKLEYTNVVYSLLSEEFTLNELQTAYESILGKKLDKRNFRKKFLQLGLIKPIKKVRKGARQRPAQIYKFISRKPSELKKFF